MLVNHFLRHLQKLMLVNTSKNKKQASPNRPRIQTCLKKGSRSSPSIMKGWPQYDPEYVVDPTQGIQEDLYTKYLQ